MKWLRYITIVFSFVAWAATAQTISNIIVGSSPNNEDGDTPRDAWNKQNWNNNFLLNNGGGGGGGLTPAQAGLQIQSTNNVFIIPFIDAVSNQFNLGASGFVTLVTNGSSTAQIQGVFNSMTNSGVVSFAPGVYTITATLNITNPMILEGNGATFSFGSGLTNFMLDTGTNYAKSLLIEHLNFDGGDYFQYFSTNFFFLTHRALHLDDIEPYFNPQYLNRSGLRAECSKGVSINACTFSGWHGNGAVFLNLKDTAGFDSDKLILHDCRFATNFIGCLLATGAEGVKAYVSNDVTGVFEENCEYATVQQSDFRENYIGVSACAGNTKIEGNQIVRNWVGLRLGGANNDTHGSYQMNTINHNNWAIWDQGSVGGGTIANNVMLRNDFNWSNDTNQLKSTAGLHFDNVQSFFFVNNRLGAETLIFTNGCVGIFANNVWESNAVWSASNHGTDFSTIYTNIDPTVSIFGNMDNYGHSLDGSASSIVAKWTNAAIPGAVLYTPNGTNSAWTTTPSFPSITASNWNPLQGQWRALFDGDSITAATFLSNSASYPYWVTNLFFPPGFFTFTTNAAETGDPISTMFARYTNSIQPFAPSGGTNALFGFQGGVNDIDLGSNATQVIFNWSNEVFAATRDGFFVVSATVIPRLSWIDSESKMAACKSLNDFITSNSMTHAIVRLDLKFSPAVAYTLDGTHPTTNSHYLWASDFYQALRMPKGTVIPSIESGLRGSRLDIASDTFESISGGVGTLAKLVGPFPIMGFVDSTGNYGFCGMLGGDFTIGSGTGSAGTTAKFGAAAASILAPLNVTGSIAATTFLQSGYTNPATPTMPANSFYLWNSNGISSTNSFFMTVNSNGTIKTYHLPLTP